MSNFAQDPSNDKGNFQKDLQGSKDGGLPTTDINEDCFDSTDYEKSFPIDLVGVRFLKTAYPSNQTLLGNSPGAVDQEAEIRTQITHDYPDKWVAYVINEQKFVDHVTLNCRVLESSDNIELLKNKYKDTPGVRIDFFFKYLTSTNLQDYCFCSPSFDPPEFTYSSQGEMYFKFSDDISDDLPFFEIE